MDKLIFQKAPNVELGTNTFIDVPTILQYDDTPLISVTKIENTGFTTEIPIYHNDGTYLAKVVGSQIYPTPDGKKAGLVIKHPDLMTVCELDGRVLFEITRKSAAAIKAQAELHTPDGYFVKYSAQTPQLINLGGERLKIGGLTMSGNTFMGCSIGVLIGSDGSVRIGCS